MKGQTQLLWLLGRFRDVWCGMFHGWDIQGLCAAEVLEKP